jgi:prolipoprotein diacylglyceryltransferase
MSHLIKIVSRHFKAKFGPNLVRMNIIMRKARPNTLERRTTPWSLLKVTMLPLFLITVTLNVFVVRVLVMLFHNFQTKDHGYES